MKITSQFVISLAGSIVLGIIGLLVGSTIGGNFGFPSFGGNSGYESGGVFFAIVGISLGSFLVVYFLKKRQKEFFNWMVSLFASALFVCIGILIFDYDMNGIGLVILLMPSVVLTLITNWQWFLKAGVKKQLISILIPFLVLILCVYLINQKKQKILELNYKPTEEFCSSLSATLYKDECSQNFDKCIVCKETPTSSYFTCHSRKFCEDKFKGESL